MTEDAASAPIGFTLGLAVRHKAEPLEDTVARADKKLYEQRALRPAVKR
jgi:PleD family two-component response regulator